MAASLAKPFLGSPYASDRSLCSRSVPPSQNLQLPARRSQLKSLDATHDFKYGWRSIQDGWRSSARKTVGRVAAGAVAKKILEQYAGTEDGWTSSARKTVGRVAAGAVAKKILEQYAGTDQDGWTSSTRKTVGRVAAGAVAKKILEQYAGTDQDGGTSSTRKTVGRVAARAVAKKILEQYAGTAVTDQDGGTSSTRKTIGRVAAGAVAKKILEQYAGTDVTDQILAYVSQVHKIVLPEDLVDHDMVTLDQRMQNTVSRDEHEIELRARVHHDPCVVPRAIPTVEAMVALVLLDQLMA